MEAVLVFDSEIHELAVLRRGGVGFLQGGCGRGEFCGGIGRHRLGVSCHVRVAGSFGARLWG